MGNSIIDVVGGQIRGVKQFPGYGNISTPYGTYGSFASALNGMAEKDEMYQAAGVLLENSMVSICRNYVAQKFVEAPCHFEQLDKDGNWKHQRDHPIQQLLDNPNPLFEGTQLFAATAASLTRGNSYLVMVDTNATQGVSQLWWVPHDGGELSAIAYGMSPYTPPGSENGIPTCYRYMVYGKIYYIPLEDVIHFRLPISDPRNPYIGYDPLWAQRAHVATDNTIGQYNYSILAHMGVPGAVFIPKTLPDGTSITFSQQAKDDFRDVWKQKAGGKNRGEAVVMDAPVEAHFPGANPEQMALKTFGDMGEARIAAGFNLNPIALQTLAGIGEAHYNVFKLATQAAWDNGIAPKHQIVHTGLTRRLIPRFGLSPQNSRAWFDYSMVPCLQEDENAKAARWGKLFVQNVVKRSVALSKLGMELPKGDQDGYASDFKPVAVPAGGNLLEDPAKQPAKPVEDTAQALPVGSIEVLTATGRQYERKVSKANATKADKVDEFVDGIGKSTAKKIGTGEPLATTSAANTRELWRAQPATEAGKGNIHTGTGPYTYDPKTQRFITADGKLVSREAEKGASEAALKHAQAEMTDVAMQLRNGKIEPVEFIAQMKDLIPQSEGAQYALARGGIGQMTNGDWSKVDAIVKQRIEGVPGKYKGLNGFDEDLKAGRYTDTENGGFTDGVVSRATLSAQAGRMTYENARVDIAVNELGHDRARSLLCGGDVQHCDECIDIADEGWVPAADFVAIGDRDCGPGDNCVAITAEAGNEYDHDDEES